MKPTRLSPSLIQLLRNSSMVQLSIQSTSLSFLQGIILSEIFSGLNQWNVFLTRNRVRPLSQCGGLERSELNKGLDTEGFYTLTDVCNMR